MSDSDDTLEDEIRRVDERLHILDGLVLALADPHALLDVLLQADDAESARHALQGVMGFSEIQATAALDLQFRVLPRELRRALNDDRDRVVAERVLLTSARPPSS